MATAVQSPISIPKRRIELASRAPFTLPKIHPSMDIEQARLLVEEAGIPSDFETIKERLTREIVNQHINIRPNRRRPFEKLLQLAKHVCSKEIIEQNIIRIRDSQKRVISEGSPELAPFLINEAIIPFAMILAEGYDEASHEHFTLDSKGDVYSVNDNNKARYPKCNAFLESKKIARQAAHAGKRRQTKKRNLKKRKTSRKSMR